MNYFPPHEYRVGNGKADDGRGNLSGHLRPHNLDALAQRQRTGNSPVQLLHRQGAEAPHRRHEQRRSGIVEQFARRQPHQPQDKPLVAELVVDRSHLGGAQRPGDHADDHRIEHTEKKPHGDGCQRRGSRLAETEREQDRHRKPECHVEDPGNDVQDDPPELPGGRRNADGNQAAPHHQKAQCEEQYPDDDQRSHELGVDDTVAVDGLRQHTAERPFVLL